jgi:amino-acid N-acetyltransferase
MIRNANPHDIPAIQKLLRANEDKLLPRTDKEITDLLETFWVAEENGEVVGCCCLEVYSKKIAEIRSVAVKADSQSRGHGTELVQHAVCAAQQRNIEQILVVTSSPKFFESLNFGPCLNEKYVLFYNGSRQREKPES